MRRVRLARILAVVGLATHFPALSATLLAGEAPVVFASRLNQGVVPPAGRSNAVELAPGGKLLLWKESGSVETLVDAAAAGSAPNTPVDVMDPDVSWDAKRIVFSGYSRDERGWRLFEVAADGTGLRQITHSDRTIDLERYGEAAARLEGFDDLDPCNLPDGRICFVSTRYAALAPDERVRATNLYVVGADGSDVHRITTERFGADTPTVEPSTGRIVYSRWWRTLQSQPTAQEAAAADPAAPQPPTPPAPIPPGSPGYGEVAEQGSEGPPPLPTPIVDPDPVTSSSVVLRGVPETKFPGVNSWFLASINPDGTGLAMHSGFRLDRERTQAYKPAFLPDGDVVALFIHQTPLLGLPGADGLRRFPGGAARPVELGGPQTFPGLAAFPSGVVYASASALDDGRILVSAAVHPSERRNFDLWVQENRDAIPQRLYGSPSFNELDPVSLTERSRPPVIKDNAGSRPTDDAPRTLEEAYAQGSFKFRCENVHANGPVNMAIPGAPPVGKGLTIELYMAPQRQSVFPADAPILITSQEIGPDGKIEATLPAGVPLFEVLKRPDGSIALGRDGQIYHVGGLNFGQAGKEARCVGCHAGHSMLEVPEDAAFTNLAPSAIVTASSTRPDVGGLFQPKALVDRRTTPVVAEWTAADSEPISQVQLRWTVPISARRTVVYAPAPGEGTLGDRHQTIRAFQVETYLSWHLQERRKVQQEILPAGTPVELDTARSFDTMVLTIRRQDVTGSIEGSRSPSLAEVEVIAKVAGLAAPAYYYVRGDANCDTEVNLSDPVSLLAGLFGGAGNDGFCCADAADANKDGGLNLTDAVFVLNYLFKGSQQPAAPFPSCGRAEEGSFGCDQEACE